MNDLANTGFDSAFPVGLVLLGFTAIVHFGGGGRTRSR